MRKAVSRGQALEVSARVNTQVDWDALDGDDLQKQIISLSPAEFRARFTAFLRNGAKLYGEDPRIITVDRSQPFDPNTFFGDETGWQIDEQDEDSLKLTEVNLSTLIFPRMLFRGESSVSGEEKLKRLKDGPHIRLDIQVFLSLWENQELIPERWKTRAGDESKILVFFDGTVLKSSAGFRHVVFLYWSGRQWDSGYRCLNDAFDENSPSAVLIKTS